MTEITQTQAWEEQWERDVEAYRLRTFFHESAQAQKVAGALLGPKATGLPEDLEDFLAELAVSYATGGPEKVFSTVHRRVYNALAMSTEEADLALREHLREEALEAQERGF